MKALMAQVGRPKRGKELKAEGTCPGCRGAVWPAQHSVRRRVGLRRQVWHETCLNDLERQEAARDPERGQDPEPGFARRLEGKGA